MTLTYNHLYDLVRRERGQKELQSLTDSFYVEAKAFFDELTHAAAADPFGGVGEASRVQLLNGRKLLRQLYELREQKILLLAQNRCRSGAALLDTANMTKDEHHLFDSAVHVLRKQRLVLHIDDVPAPLVPEPVAEKTVAEQPDKVSIRVLADVPQFVGPSMEQYGPYTKDETVELPQAIAGLLIRRGSAEKD